MQRRTDSQRGKPERIYALSSSPINTDSLRKSYNSLKKVLRVTIMPTELHDCCQDWWRLAELSLRQSGDLTFDEQTQIMTRVGTSMSLYASLNRLLTKSL